jgi:hypothetical protein
VTRRCPLGCGNDFRKGRDVQVLSKTGELVQRRVCKSCASRALRIVAPIAPEPKPPTVVRSAQLDRLALRIQAMIVSARHLSPPERLREETLKEVLHFILEAQDGRPL